jgi:hypothetical protein
LQKSNPENLSLNLSLGSAAWTALAEIGRQLQILAATQTGPHLQSALTSHPAPWAVDSVTVGDLAREFLFAKARAGKSDRYLGALRNSLGKFVAGRASTPVAAVTVHDVEKWLHAHRWSSVTMRHYCGDVRTLFNFAVRRGYLQANPAAGVELPAARPSAVVIHTPAQVEAVLEFARGYDLNICRALAVRYFAGLRSAEVDKLDEAQVGADYVEVTARNSKTRRRRLVAVSPNLAAWLALGGKLPVTGCKSNVWRDFTAALKRATGVPWANNVTRHSFVSYHLAAGRSAAATALEAGHTEAMTFAHYREIVKKADADRFWEIRPKTTS